MIITLDENKVVNTLTGLYPFATFTFSHERFNDRLKITVAYHDQYCTALVDYSVLHSESLPNDFLIKIGMKVANELMLDIPEGVIGAYPFARLWHDTHSASPDALLFNPSRPVPGWVFGTIKKKGSVYPIDPPAKKLKPLCLPEPGSLLEVDVGDSPWATDVIDRTIRIEEQSHSIANQIKENKMADAKRVVKKKITRAPIKGFDPKKVRTPECNVHHAPMKFDSVEQKWCCTIEGCRVVARPKRDADDKTVLLGKGEVQLRLIAQDGNLSVVLISDDNIALDITKLVNTQQIIDVFDVRAQAQVAFGSGKSVFDIPQPRNVTINTRLLVMGADDLTG